MISKGSKKAAIVYYLKNVKIKNGVSIFSELGKSLAKSGGVSYVSNKAKQIGLLR